MEIAKIHQLFKSCDSVSIDTRKITPNSLFVALKGENFDANAFTAEALSKGAKYVIIDNSNFYIDERTILVNDSLETLQELARFHRQYLNIPIIALTGSNGKTTTKELIKAVLSKKYKTDATIGNLNNHIGVPLTLLSFNKSTDIGVVEMGANHQKEIEFLCTIATPDYGYITNFGKAHLEGFGGTEGVIKGKSEMYTYLLQNDKTVFINLDDPIQAEKSTTFNRYTFSSKQTIANVIISEITANPFVTIKHDEQEIKTHLIGLYNANNINAALTIGTFFNVPKIAIKEALENYIPENNRSQLLEKGSNSIILDAYNANPSSMAVAIDNFVQLDKPNKIVVLADMFELGPESLKEHQLIVERLSNQTEIKSFFIGKDFYSNQINIPNLHFFASFDEFSTYLSQHPFENATLLIKGSRGMALERTLHYLQP